MEESTFIVVLSHHIRFGHDVELKHVPECTLPTYDEARILITCVTIPSKPLNAFAADPAGMTSTKSEENTKKRQSMKDFRKKMITL